MKTEYSSGIIVYEGIAKERKYLLLIRHDGKLDFPKGHIEKGENSTAAALRETKEESNSFPKIIPGFKEKIHYLFLKNYDKTKKPEKIHKYVRMFLGESKGDKIRVSKEHLGYKWLSLRDTLSKVKYKNSKDILRHADAYLGKIDLMKKMNHEYSSLPKNQRPWNLSSTFVPGEGSLDAKIMFVGQAPGQNEDMLKRPFVGRSGRVLDGLIRGMGLSREDVYVTSVVQFFPPKNRAPTPKEIELCKPFLYEQIGIITPKVIVMLGKTSCAALLEDMEIGKNHGKVIEKDGIKYFLTFHPAAALRFPKLEKVMRADFQKLREISKKN